MQLLLCKNALSALKIITVSPLSEELSFAYDLFAPEEYPVYASVQLHPFIAGVVRSSADIFLIDQRLLIRIDYDYIGVRTRFQTALLRLHSEHAARIR